jgi:hypothetical protein
MASGPAGWSSPTGTWGSIASTPSYSKNYSSSTPDLYSSSSYYRPGRGGKAKTYSNAIARGARTGGVYTSPSEGSWLDIFGGSTGMTGIGDLFTGIGGLAQGWGALKDAKLAREALAQQQKQWEQNYESQRLVTNNAIANQNAWKQAQGRTDFGAYVGGKPAGSNYIG